MKKLKILVNLIRNKTQTFIDRQTNRKEVTACSKINILTPTIEYRMLPKTLSTRCINAAVVSKISGRRIIADSWDKTYFYFYSLEERFINYAPS